MQTHNYLNQLNKGQYEAATTIQGPVRILAGAGSGKTHTLISRVAYMIDCGISPEQILLLTFTNNAAKNMVERASTMANPKCANITACTYHSFCAKLLRQYGKFIGIESNFTILTPAEAADAVKLVKSQRPFYEKIRKFPVPKKIVDIYSKSQNMMLPVEDTIEIFYKDYIIQTPHIQTLIQEYQEYKRQKNMMDYDDLLVNTLHMLHNDTIRNQISDTYRYIMVDEYQDTNALQEKILFLIADKYKNLAIVGDDYQSIYAFRGSDINNILHFPERFSEECKTVMVNINYRSTEEILTVANNMMGAYAKFGCKKIMYANNKHGEKPYLYKPANVDGETEYVIKHIEKLRIENEPLSQIAILERNSMSSFQIENELNRHCIPYRKLGGLKFMEYVCILDMLALMRALTNDKDELAFYRILDLLPRIGSIYANNIVSALMNEGISLQTIDKYRNRDFYKYLEKLIETVLSARNETEIGNQFEILYSFYIDIRQYKIDHLNTKDADKKLAEADKLKSDVETLSVLRDMVLSYGKIIDFLDDIVLDVNKQTDDDGEMLTISTIHSAKGMEWKHVFMIQCTDGAFPKYAKYDHDPHNDKDYLEELRCFYVAITRAKEFLHIIAPVTLSIYGKTITGNVAHFLDHSMDAMQPGRLPILPEESLSFAFVPRSLREKGLQSALNYTEWDSLQNNIDSQEKCSICGQNALAMYVQEFWDYDDKNHIQLLRKVGGVCEDCFRVFNADYCEHGSYSYSDYDLEEVLNHYASVNECSREKAESDYSQALKIWEERNKYQWKQQIDMEMVKKMINTPVAETFTHENIYLHVPYEQKDAAKQLGARWDRERRRWYIPANCQTPVHKFAAWT